jgi:FixJ family two-component response regulator
MTMRLCARRSKGIRIPIIFITGHGDIPMARLRLPQGRKRNR